MKHIQELVDAVNASRSVSQSAIILLNGINARIEAAGVDPVKLAQVVSDLKTETTALSEAVVANTPAANNP